MKTAFLLSLMISLSASLVFAAEPPPENFDAVRARARQMGETEEGKVYEKHFSEALAKPMQAALRECTKDTKPPYLVNVVFVVGADGTVTRILWASDQSVSACVANKLNGVKLALPPKADWLVSVNIKIEE
ncbi:MAG TPA: hypothetical protein VK961_07065 [Chthoniobacter sp.]|nr:hypothetical protein [Chthoniobacter sp.]